VRDWAAEMNSEQAKAIAEIEKIGGKVTVDEKNPDKPVKSLRFGRGREKDGVFGRENDRSDGRFGARISLGA
jgi:hypothetical protein